MKFNYKQAQEGNINDKYFKQNPQMIEFLKVTLNVITIIVKQDRRES